MTVAVSNGPYRELRPVSQFIELQTTVTHDPIKEKM